MKNIKYILTFLLFIFYLSPAYSQDKIATLDVVKLLKDSKAAISMNRSIKLLLQKNIENKSQEKQKDYTKTRRRIIRQKSTLTPEAFSDRKNSFEKKVIEFNKYSQT